MSIFTKKGKEVQQQQEQIDRKKVLKFLKSGESLKVAVLSAEDFGEYLQHGGYTLSNKYGVYNMPCLKHTGKEDLYDKAVPLMYQDAEEAEKNGDKKKAEEIRLLAGELRAKKRMLFGFVDLETGEQIVVDVTRGQGENLVDTILEYEDSITEYPFLLEKKGTKANTTVTLSPIVNMKKLTKTEQANFEAVKGEKFDHELFEKIFFVKPEEQQIQDLIKIGFDVSRIGIDPDSVPQPQEKQEKVEEKPDADLVDEEDLPF